MVLSEINEFLNQLQPTMMKLVLGEICLPLWSPQPGIMFDATSAHIRKLRIPFLKGKPNVLLHDLGSFKDDPTLAARINNIFMPNNHTQVTSQVSLRALRLMSALVFLSTHLVLVNRGCFSRVFVVTGVFTSPPSLTQAF